MELGVEGDKGRSPENLASLAYLDLLVGNLEGASNLYREAARAGNNPSYSVNLGAVLLARFETDEKPEAHWLVDALEALGGSTGHQREAACYNEIRILSRLHLERQAATLRETCADPPDDKNSGSAAEPALGTSEAARARFEELLLQWSGAVDAGQDLKPIQALLETARDDLVAAEDRALADVVTELKSGDRTARQRLAYGLRLYVGAVRSAAAHEYSETLDQLLQAERTFREADSRLAAWSTLEAARVAYHTQQPQRALELLNGISDSEARPVLVARVSWVAAVVLRALGRPTESDHHLADAMRRYEELGERAIVGFLASNRANTAFDLGDRQRSWRFRLSALETLDTLSTERLFTVLSNAAEVALREGSLYSARGFLAELDARLAFADVPLLQHLTAVQSAVILARLGDPESGRSHLRMASGLIERSAAANPAFGDRMISRAAMADAELLHAEAKHAEARERLSGVLSYLRSQELPLDIAEVLMKRARVQRVAGRIEEAKIDLELAILELEDGWSRVLPDQRPLFFERTKELFDARIELELEGGAAIESIYWAERSKARSVVEALRSSNEAPNMELSVESLTRSLASLPDQLAILEFAVLDDKLISWLVRRDDALRIVTSVDRIELTERVRGVRRDVLAGGDGGADAEALFDLLIAPHWADLQGFEQLSLVPDGVLHELPFALLRKPGGPYLLEDLELSLAPSLISLTLAERRHRPVGPPSRVLAIAHGKRPSFIRDLRDLPHADSEAANIAALYPYATLLNHGKATLPMVRAEVVSKDVVHIAAHAIANPASASERWILLAPDPEAPGEGSEDRSGILTAAEFASMNLDDAQIVILSACATAYGGPLLRDGVQGLVNPILSAGVPSVVASLWPIEDQAAAAFLMDFHQEFSKGRTAESALRSAQLAATRNPESRVRPAVWASFQVYL